MWARILVMGALLSAAQGGDGEGGAGAGGAAGTAGQPGSAPSSQTSTAPAFDEKAAKEAAEIAVLKALGFESREAFEADKAARKRAADEKLSESEKKDVALKDALDGRGKAEASAEKHKTRADAAEAALAMRDLLDGEGVRASERRIVEVLLDDARAAAKKDGKQLDQKAFFEALRKERAYLFGGAAPAPATTSPAAPAASPYGNGPAAGGAVDALTMSDDDYLKFRNSKLSRALAPKGFEHGTDADSCGPSSGARQSHSDQHAIARTEGRTSPRLDVPALVRPAALASAHRPDAHYEPPGHVRCRPQAGVGFG